MRDRRRGDRVRWRRPSRVRSHPVTPEQPDRGAPRIRPAGGGRRDSAGRVEERKRRLTGLLRLQHDGIAANKGFAGEGVASFNDRNPIGPNIRQASTRPDGYVPILCFGTARSTLSQALRCRIQQILSQGRMVVLRALAVAALQPACSMTSRDGRLALPDSSHTHDSIVFLAMRHVSNNGAGTDRRSTLAPGIGPHVYLQRS